MQGKDFHNLKYKKHGKTLKALRVNQGEIDKPNNSFFPYMSGIYNIIQEDVSCSEYEDISNQI